MGVFLYLNKTFGVYWRSLYVFYEKKSKLSIFPVHCTIFSELFFLVLYHLYIEEYVLGGFVTVEQLLSNP